MLWQPRLELQKPTIITLNQQEKNSIASRTITSKAPIAPTDKLPTGAITKQGVYVPPQMRNKNGRVNFLELLF